MKDLLFLLSVGAGGFFGAIGRFLVGAGMRRWLGPTLLPFGTMAANLIGCGVLGVIVGATSFKDDAHWKGFVVIGVLGGFTTFSSFGNETFQLARDGNGAAALTNVAINLFGGLAAVALGYYAAQRIV